MPSNGRYYAHRGDYSKGPLFRKTIMLHRFIMNAPEGMEVDHINGDGLDNRRVNLRLVTKTENLRSRKTFKSNKTGYKGVVYNPQNGRWKVTINLGTYDTAEEA